MDWMTPDSIPGKRFFSSKHLTGSGVYPASYTVGMREAVSWGSVQRDHSLCLMLWLRMSGVIHLLPLYVGGPKKNEIFSIAIYLFKKLQKIY